MATKVVTVRVPEDLFDQLPERSFAGKRSHFIVEAIREKLSKNAKRVAREQRVVEIEAEPDPLAP